MESRANMAAKSHADHSSVSERRLRPIYDWLDTGNNKKALQEADKVLKKQPNFQCARVLKALALLRLGRAEESVPILVELHSEVPTDDNTLQAIAICYKELNWPERICDLYECAVKKDPGSEELLTHLFVACVRVGDYRRQQQVAMSLYKLKNKNPYYFWAVMSVVMQASQLSEEVAQSVTLPLAERMVRKLVDENRLEAEQEVLLYLMILEMQGKVGEALEVVEGSLGQRLLVSPNCSPVLKKTQLLSRLGQWRQLVLMYPDLIRGNPDQMSYYQAFVKVAFQVDDEQKESSGKAEEGGREGQESENKGSMIEEAVSLVLEMCEKRDGNKDAKMVRAPFLAKIELCKQLEERKCCGVKRMEQLGTMEDALEAYVSMFGDRSCCFSDLQHYILALDEARREHFLKMAEGKLELDDDGNPASMNQMFRHICLLQWKRLLGHHDALSALEKRALASDLLCHYSSTGRLLPEQQLPTDVRPNDTYPLIAAHLLHDAWEESKDSTALLEAAAVLEHALTNSPCGFSLRLPLVRIYQRMGAGEASHAHIEALDVKHVQLDTLGHLLMRHTATLGMLRAAEEQAALTLRFFAAGNKDVADQVVSAYKFGNFGHVPEFLRMRERLARSMHLATVTIEKMAADLVTDTSGHEDVMKMAAAMELDAADDGVKWDALCDSRDYTVMVSWAPLQRRPTEKSVKHSFEADVIYLRLRHLMLRCLAAALSLAPGATATSGMTNGASPEGTSPDPTSLLSSLVEELRQRVADASKAGWLEEPPLSEQCLQGPSPSRLHLYLQVKALDMVTTSLRLCLVVHRVLADQSTTGEAEKAAQAALDEACALQERVKELGALAEEAGKEVGIRCEFLERIFNLTEAVGLSAIACGVVHLLLRPPGAPSTHQARKGKRKGRREKEVALPTLLPSVAQTFNKTCTSLQEVLRGLESTLSQFQSVASVNDLVSELAGTLRVQQVVSWNAKPIQGTTDAGSPPPSEMSALSVVLGKMDSSYRKTVQEMGRVLQLKAKYLQGVQV